MKTDLSRTRKAIAERLGYEIQDAIIFEDSSDFAHRYQFAVIIEAPWATVLECLACMAENRLPKDKKILDIQVFVMEYDVGCQASLALSVWVEK